VLGRVLPELSTKRWVAGTAIAAAFAWLIGLMPSTVGSSLSTWPVGALIVVGMILGTLLLCSIGTAQWVELRRHVPRAGWWVVVTAGAWCAGLLAFVAVTSLLWQPDQAALVVAAIGMVGGLIMASTMAATSGWALVRLLGLGSGSQAVLRRHPGQRDDSAAAPARVGWRDRRAPAGRLGLIGSKGPRSGVEGLGLGPPSRAMLVAWLRSRTESVF
jgi:hypothetical protein